MNLEYNICPICGASRNDNEEKCSSCGFVYVPIDKENSTDIAHIEQWQKEHKRKPIWTFVATGLSIVGLIISPFLYDEYSYDQTSFILTLIVSIFGLLISLCHMFIPSGNTIYLVERKDIIEAVEKEEEEKRREEKRKTRQLAKVERTNAIISKYGKPTKVYYYFNFRKGVGLRVMDDFSVFDSDNVAIFNESQHLMVGDKFFPFSSIIGYKLVDDKRVIHGEEVSVSSPKSGDALRTAFFALTNDTEWTVASAGNTRRETVTFKGDDKESHEYTLYVNIDDLSEPIVKIPIGRSADIAYELNGVMNVIVRRNQKS